MKRSLHLTLPEESSLNAPSSPLSFAPRVEISLSSSSDGGSFRGTPLFLIPNLKFTSEILHYQCCFFLFFHSVLAGNNERGPDHPVP